MNIDSAVVAWFRLAVDFVLDSIDGQGVVTAYPCPVDSSSAQVMPDDHLPGIGSIGVSGGYTQDAREGRHYDAVELRSDGLSESGIEYRLLSIVKHGHLFAYTKW